MTIPARIVKAIVALPILGTVSRNELGEVVKKAERYRIHLYAAKPGMKYEKQTHTHLLVGVMDGGAYTTEHAKRSEEVLLPYDRELIALRVDGYGVPICWDSLPVEVESHPDKAAEQLCELIQKTITDRLHKEKQPGGLLYGK